MRLGESPAEENPKGWYSRGYLPHLDLPGLTQFITFRLADSLPKSVVNEWKQELRYLPESERKREQDVRCNRYLDAGIGACYLGDEAVAEAVEEVLLFDHLTQYELLAWCIMPNHVHCLARFQEGASMHRTVKLWKGVSAHRANMIIGRTGRLWHREYHDRYIRNAEHFDKVIRYIDSNPVKANLCAVASDWLFGSARFGPPSERTITGSGPIEIRSIHSL